MSTIEKIREFLYDLDKIRKDPNAVHALIIKYMGLSDENSGGLLLKIEIGEVDYLDDEMKLWITLGPHSEGIWVPIHEDDKNRLKRKDGDIIVETRI